jgi:hypothetical protein
MALSLTNMQNKENEENSDHTLTHDSDLTKLPFDQVPGPLMHVTYKQRAQRAHVAKHGKDSDENPPLGPKPDE